MYTNTYKYTYTYTYTIMCTVHNTLVYIYIHKDIYIQYTAVSNIKQETEAQAFFLNTFTDCSSYKRKFVVCLFVDEEQTEVIRLQTN